MQPVQTNLNYVKTHLFLALLLLYKLVLHNLFQLDNFNMNFTIFFKQIELCLCFKKKKISG